MMTRTYTPHILGFIQNYSKSETKKNLARTLSLFLIFS